MECRGRPTTSTPLRRSAAVAIELTVLGSGSSGNASLLDADGFGLLIDAGLGVRQIGARLTTCGKSWNDVHAAILTHVHTDHWKETTLKQFCKRGVPFYCHPEHAAHLLRVSSAFRALHAD